MNSRRSTMLLRLVAIALVIIVTGIGFCDTHFMTHKTFEVPESAYHHYTHLAYHLARFKSRDRRRAFYLLSLTRVVWPRGKPNQVTITIDVADSTCRRWPKYPQHFRCKPRVNSVSP
ncbi:hypothetical protein MTO96_051628 [Rhipicephalus appendiculatus]